MAVTPCILKALVFFSMSLHTQPSVLIVSYIESAKAAAQFGFYQKAEWKPDDSMIAVAVSTTLWHVILSHIQLFWLGTFLKKTSCWWFAKITADFVSCVSSSFQNVWGFFSLHNSSMLIDEGCQCFCQTWILWLFKNASKTPLTVCMLVEKPNMNSSAILALACIKYYRTSLCGRKLKDSLRWRERSCGSISAQSNYPLFSCLHLPAIFWLSALCKGGQFS